MSEATRTFIYTLIHQRIVQDSLLTMALELMRRAIRHDISKLSEPELSGFVEINHIAREQGYASQDYQESLKSEAVKHHWAVNDHHPEHFEGSIESMRLVQIIEMVCDWKAVSIQKKLNFKEMLEEQYERFKCTPEQKYLIEKIIREFEE